MPETPLPTLDKDLNQGHSQDCLETNIDDFPEINDLILQTANNAHAALYDWVIDKDLEFADSAVSLLETRNLQHRSIQMLLAKLNNFQNLLRRSSLSDEEKQRLWQPIAECYTQVQETLAKIITPLEEREEWLPGETKEIEVILIGTPTITKVLANSHISPYQFSSPQFTYGRTEKPRRHLRHLSFIDFYSSHCTDISPLTLKLLGRKKRATIKVKVKLISHDREMIPMGEIDKEDLQRLIDKQEAA